MLTYDEMGVKLSNAFMEMFACMFWNNRYDHIHVHMGIQEDGKCFTTACVDNSCPGDVTLSLHAPSFTETFRSCSAYNKFGSM